MMKPSSPSAVTPFLERFEPSRRGVVSNHFYLVLRNGAETPEAIIGAVAAELWRKIGSTWTTEDALRKHKDVLDALRIDQAGALAFAAECLRREQMSPAERKAMRDTRAAEGRRAWMAGCPPTEKQIGYLRAMGSSASPATMLEASDLIAKLKAARFGR